MARQGFRHQARGMAQGPKRRQLHQFTELLPLRILERARPIQGSGITEGACKSLIAKRPQTRRPALSSTRDDMLLAQSAVDRCANNAYDLVIEGESYRPRLKPSIETSGPPPQTPIQK